MTSGGDMPHSEIRSSTHTTDYRYIESALTERRHSLDGLWKEMRDFQPEPIEAFEPQRQAWIAKVRELNPNMTPEAVEEFASKQVTALAETRFQFLRRFDDRFNGHYVAVTLLSHALCEALINTVLALGLGYARAHELFPALERVEFRDKWTIAPKAILHTYTFPRDGQLYEGLRFLAKQRNALVHYKTELHINEENVLEGSALERFTFDRDYEWLCRFSDLPYQLLEHAVSQLPGVAGVAGLAIMLLRPRG